ncbi:MAG: BolA/IbaG family iron-sulfur metabolism protein [Thermoleophilia bacterium]|nr:BolA/IbaG family iron-sulfur metabolism protein [Thermoleophilia bacterium]
MLTAEHVRDRIVAALPEADVEVVDTTGTGDHFSAQVIAAAFVGVSRLDQHRMVYDAVAAELANGSLHALELRTRARDEQ